MPLFFFINDLRQAYESELITQALLHSAPRHPRFLMALGNPLMRLYSKTAATDLVPRYAAGLSLAYGCKYEGTRVPPGRSTKVVPLLWMMI